MANLPHPATENTSSKQEYYDDSTYNDHVSSAHDSRIEMDQEEIDAIIRNKRKVRDPKACYACHRRKVKCDRNLPCDSCVKRDHPELCSYERPTKKRRIALTNTQAQGDGAHSDGNDAVVNVGSNVTVPKEQWESINRELLHLRTQMQRSEENNSSTTVTPTDPVAPEPLSRSDDDREGIHAPSNQMGTMHLGSKSVLAYMMGNRPKSTQDAARSLLEENILPNLGLDNETATYPFVDLWSTDSSMQDVDGLCKALPEDALCQEFWQAYRDVACTIYPVVPETDVFGNTLNYLLQRRAEANRTNAEIDPNRPFGVSMPWLSLLFSVLASGSQSANRAAKERELTSQVYICCSYQALRMSNFMTHPCLETIQACLIIGNALSYNMNPGVAYVFLGMTLRSALSMGLHVNSQGFTEHENYLRGRIWWALAWQDSHFSVSYDRPSASILCFPEIPYTKHSAPGKRSYPESMIAVIRLTQEILRDRTLNPRAAMSWSAIQRYRDEVDRICKDALPRLRDRQLCTLMTDHLERLALKLHCSYLVSEICRPALREDSSKSGMVQGSNHTPIASPSSRRRKSSISSHSPTSSPGDASLQGNLRAECAINLENTVSAYVELYSINAFAARSWIGIQRSVSAAFLLGILPETRQQPRIIRLLTELEYYISKRAMEDAGFPCDLPSENHDIPTTASNRKLAVVNGGSRPGTGDPPTWARSMIKSLNALGKLNAALASGQRGYTGQQYAYNGPTSAAHMMAPQHQQMSNNQTYNNPPLATAGGSAATNPSIANILTASGGGGQHSQMNQYPIQPSYSIHHTSQSYPSQMAGAHQHEHLGTVNMSNTGVGPITPDSTSSSTGTGSDWNYTNMTERALEYVQPGLWG